MNPAGLTSRQDDGRLWVIALALSVLLNAAAVVAVGISYDKISSLRKTPAPPAAPPVKTVAMIYPQQLRVEAAPPPAASAQRRFARTSEDQASPPSKRPAFIGERDTQAASDRAPVPKAPPLPSQAGVQPKYDGDLETTESDYRDGSLDRHDATDTAQTDAPSAPPAPADSPAKPAAPSPEMAAPASARAEPVTSVPPARERLLDGPNPVDVPVPKDIGEGAAIKPAAKPPEPPSPAKEIEQTPPPPKAAKDAGFRGHQRKTAITGSISRTGRSALDVEDSPLGRYHAAISRAVELEWQRNCVRHRDFITPGFLTVRFFVEPSGRVRSVQFVGDMESGEVQKGFTLNSIRDAKIPAMPRTLRQQYDQDPLELIFRFFF